MNGILRKISILSLFLLLIGIISTAYAHAEDAPFYIQQDTNILNNRNGEIVSQKLIKVDSGYEDRIDCYKIRYLSDGLEVVGFIVKPKKIDSKLPVLIFNRGGNREFMKIKERGLKYLSSLAANNYLVLATQYRGNDGGQGKEQFGGTDINDVLDLISLTKSLQFTDSNNIFMLGYSRGGMMTYLALKYGVQINAAVVVSGVADLWRSCQEREGMKRLMADLVGLDIEEYHKRSAVYWPEKLNAPLLIMHGKRDIKVSYKQSLELSKKLKELGKDHELIIFPKGNHGLTKNKPERDAKILAWFDKHKK